MVSRLFRTLYRRKLCYDRDGKNVWISSDTQSRCISNDKVKEICRQTPIERAEMSELNPLDVLAHTASTEDDQVKNMGPSFPGLPTSTPKLDGSAFRKRERMRVLQDMFSNSYQHSTEEDDYQTFSRAHIGVQIYPDVKSKGVQVFLPTSGVILLYVQQPPHIKEVEEEVWMSQEGECPVGQEEADVSKFPLTVVSVKTEEHEDKPPESSQLHHSPSVLTPMSEGSRRQLWTAQAQLFSDIQQVSAESHEEIPSKQQECSFSVGQKELQAPSHIKEEEEELWKQLQMLVEDNDEDEAQSLQLHHSQSEENRGVELVSQHITEADGEHCEDIKSEPDSIFAPLSDMDHMMSHSSDHSDHIQKPLESKNDSKGDTRHHTNNKHLDCSECGKSFRHKSYITIHMRIHTGEKPFTCSVCKKSFSRKLDMTTHMRTHTGEKPFTCSVCKKSFSTKLVMTTHMRTHTGEKPVTCSICKKSFSRKQYMTKHMRTHTGENPLSCTVCDKRFRYKYQVSKHKCVTVMEAAGI
ncbi:zinc finger protein 568-like isoform X2 [Nerophis ophidion]|uniref:zinc finger protein 568-like isoform X2 n=1 Tax=Nerophis ophidion TaxID=159077 RepID=UPI002ADFF920|nr:zinc finger protein 568-like isoform X2 [Nerophis ophidion]